MIPSLSSVLSTNTRCPCVFAFEVERDQELSPRSIHSLSTQSLSNRLISLSDSLKEKGVEARPSVELSASEYISNASIWGWLQTIISQSALTPISSTTISSGEESTKSDEHTEHTETVGDTINSLPLFHPPEQVVPSAEDGITNIPHYRLLIKTNEWIYQEEMASALIYEVSSNFSIHLMIVIDLRYSRNRKHPCQSSPL